MKRWLLILLALPFSLLAQPRIITIGGDVTEIVFDLDNGQNVVARDSTSLQPTRVRNLPDIGYLRQLNTEGILSLRPTLVLASELAQPSMVLKQLENNGVKVVTVPGETSPEGILHKIAVVADALGAAEQGRSLQQQVKQALAAIPSRPLPVKVLFILSHSGMSAMAAGRQTAADAAIKAAGLENAMSGYNHYQALSQEGVIASAPDLVVISRDGAAGLGGEDRVWQLPGLALTPAGRHHRLLLVDDMALLGFGPSTPQAIAQLRRSAESVR
ncbi:heme/hemin ABC transporter substrate-binding protein [Martelella alba]|uniref:Hemin ABC transporter substrate-binding protein n=1 Tax=Martelella alba TaxID=2590451 RepID=A0ABY2SLJ0_9HYPH|nr:hemin ABC transporter substrate-binding protein [Martelella alba]TKI06601.1 hemin ABC transporter substrate-binding protein [Martelella alba]